MQRYFSHICDGTDVQADRRIDCTFGRAPNAIDISQGSLTCLSTPAYVRAVDLKSGGLAMLVVKILPWTRFLVMFTCSVQLDWHRSNEIKHDIHARS